MTYKEKYFEIINSGLKEKPENVYTEHHHIIPKSVCPLLKKSLDNLIYLTAKQHFLAHYYIWKWFKCELKDKKWSNKMCYAFHMMKRLISKCDDIEKLSDLYEEVRKELIPWNKGLTGVLSEETRKKISESLKGDRSPMYGKKLSEEARKKMSEAQNKKQILQYTKDGIFIKEWKSIKDAEKELQIDNSSISRCCKGKQKSCGGFVWKYKEEKKTEN